MSSQNPGSWNAAVDWRPLYAAITIATDPEGTPIQTWATDTRGIDDEARRLAVITDAAHHGWQLTPTDEQGPGFIAAPLDWQVILTEVTARRLLLQQQLAMVDKAWQDCIVHASRQGQIPATALAKTADITRGRVYQILNDPARQES